MTPRALAQPSSRACCTLRQISMPPRTNILQAHVPTSPAAHMPLTPTHLHRVWVVHPAQDLDLSPEVPQRNVTGALKDLGSNEGAVPARERAGGRRGRSTPLLLCGCCCASPELVLQAQRWHCQHIAWPRRLAHHLALCTTPNSPSTSFSMISRESGSISLQDRKRGGTSSRQQSGQAGRQATQATQGGDRHAGSHRRVHSHTAGRPRGQTQACRRAPHHRTHALNLPHSLLCCLPPPLTTQGQSRTSFAARSQTPPPACCP
jgi:hypothetical protein